MMDAVARTDEGGGDVGIQIQASLMTNQGTWDMIPAGQDAREQAWRTVTARQEARQEDWRNPCEIDANPLRKFGGDPRIGDK